MVEHEHLEISEGGSESSKPVLPPRTLPNRACTECRRKKSKCDMKHPECSLCCRIGETCVYPTRRASKRKRHLATQNSPEKTSHSLDGGSTAGASERHCAIVNTSPDINYDAELFDFTTSYQEFTWHDPLVSLDPFVDMPGECQVGFNFLNNNLEMQARALDPALKSPWLENQAAPYTMYTDGDHQGTFVLDEDTQSIPTLYAESFANAGLGFRRNTWSNQASLQTQTYAMDVSPSVAVELIHQFFEHVHCFLPLFHREKFNERYQYFSYSNKSKVDCLSLESALVLNGMFSLSARFSTSDTLRSGKPLHRGDRFFQDAMRLYELSYKVQNEGDTSLEFLQGVILLTFNALQSGPTRQGWLLSGVCSRLAYELGLHNTDADVIAGVVDPCHLMEEMWRDREERRRAWWVVWDMDTFANSLALTPFALDLQRANVLLPMPDDAWIGSRKIISAYLDANSPNPWTRLSDLSDQNPWAWFLACTAVLRQAVEVVLSQKFRSQVLDGVEARADCFAMALPDTFHLELDALIFDDNNFGEMNWIVSTLMMLQFSRSFMRLQRNTLNSLQQKGLKDLPNASLQRFQNSPDPQSAEEYRRFQKEMGRIVKAWSPRYLVFSTPLITFSLVGPAFVHLLENQNVDSLSCLNLEILKLALKRLARYWMIAEILLEKLQVLELERSTKSFSMMEGKELWPPILNLKT